MERDRSSVPHIRPATAEDLPFVLGLVSRLVEFGPPPWRDADAIRASSEGLLRDALERPRDGAAVLLAVGADGAPLGFVHLGAEREFFTGAPEGYVANLALADATQGRGVGRALMEAAEAWTRSRGMRRLTLYVFAGNDRARGFYARLGFGEDSLKLVKQLGG